MWNMKLFVITVIIGATGIINKRLKTIWKKYWENVHRFSSKSNCSSDYDEVLSGYQPGQMVER
jgi:amino acid permease